MFDVDKIRGNISVSSVVGKELQLVKNGNEYKCLCPFHADGNPSLTINDDKGFFHCFACGAHGDVIDFVMDYHKVTFKEACEILGGEKQAPNAVREQRAAKPAIDYYADLEDADVSAAPAVVVGKQVQLWNHKQQKVSRITPRMVFPYRDAAGNLLGYVLRAEINGVKWTPTIRYCKRQTGETGWTIAPFKEPRPLYGLDKLAGDSDSQVFVCEGEKATDAAARIFGKVCVTWPGGTNNVKHTDWSPLKGRRVIIWGDADKPGWDAAQEVASLCNVAGAADIKVIKWDETKPKGWDAADAEADGMGKAEVVEWAKPRLVTWSAPEPQEVEEQADEREPDRAHEPVPQQEPDQAPEPEYIPEEQERDWEPFRFLGFQGDTMFFMPNDSCQILAHKPSQLTVNNLQFLAPLAYWEQLYPKKGKFDIEAAIGALIGKSKQVGFFDEERIRGRGAWIERDRAVVNLGTKIYCSGNMHRIGDFESEYIYEASKSLSINMTSPATSAEAQRLVKVCQSLSWEKSLSGDLLAGWCVIAAVCGALKWRPHIWVTGSAGSGKSTVINDIIKSVVGQIAINCDGNSTEAYVRQKINRDARPVIMDEVESENQQQTELMQKVLGLARISSSGGDIGKGGADGNAKTYSVRSCFCFSSINTSAYHTADESRISKLVLKRNEAENSDEQYGKLCENICEWFTPEFSEKLFARTVANLPTLLKNARTFTDAASSVIKSRRAADQIGTLLAGRYLCNSVNEISFANAVKWIDDRKASLIEYTSVTSTKDESKLLTRLMTHRVRVQGENTTHDITIGELVLGLDEDSLPYGVTARSAEAELKRSGFRVGRRDDDGAMCLFIANGSPAIEKMLRDTQWAKTDISRPLRTLQNASATKAMYYSSGLTARGTAIPLSLIKPNTEE